MITRGTKLQLLAFAVLTVVGVSYALVRYLGVGAGILDNRYQVYVELANSGGIFSNAEVTYRGVEVGRVGSLTLTPGGVRAELILERRKGQIPADTLAVVANRSAVGEQYLDLQPRRQPGPGTRYLADGDVIPQRDTRLPVSTAALLADLDALLTSTDPKDLGTVITELDRAFRGTADDLQRLIDANNRLIKAADEVQPETVSLLRNGKTVLATQRASSSAIKSFAKDLAALTDALRESDPHFRGVVDNAPRAAIQTNALINDLSPTVPILLDNLTSAGQVVAARIPALRQLLVAYPLAVSGSFSVTPGDGAAHFGTVFNSNAPEPCRQGYGETKIRYPQDTSDAPVNLNAYCKEPHNSPIDVRGYRNHPTPGPTPRVPGTAGDGDAERHTARGAGSDSSTQRGAPHATPTTAGGNQVYVTGYDPATGAVLGPDGRQYRLRLPQPGLRMLGDASWEWLLLWPLSE